MTTYAATFTFRTATRNSATKVLTHAVAAPGSVVTFHSSLAGAQTQVRKLETYRGVGFAGVEIVAAVAR